MGLIWRSIPHST